MNYTVEYDNVLRDEWTTLLQQFGDANIYQTWEYGSVRWGEKSLSHQVVKRNGEIISIAQITIKKVPFLGLGVAYIPWGPLWRKKDNPIDTKNLQNSIRFLREEYVKKRRLFLRVRPNIFESNINNIKEIFQKEGFLFNFSERKYRTLIVDLTPPIENLRKNLDQKWRNMLNQAEKKGLEIVEGNSDELYSIFLKLQSEMQERKKYTPGVNFNEFREIQKILPQSLKMRIFIAKFEGEPMSSAIFSKIGDTGIYLLGATGYKGLKTKASYLLQWRAIQWLKENGCKWYDLGGINPKDNPGVYHFKMGLSGVDVHHIGIYESCNNFLKLKLVKWGEKVKSYMNHGKRN